MSRDIPDQIVLHDYLQVNGGAERLVVSLTRGLSNFKLGVAGIYPEFAGSGNLMGLSPYVLSGKFSFLPRVLCAWLTFSNIRFSSSTKCVIYSGIYAPLAVKHQTQGKRILYCHTPPRFAFDRELEYLNRANVLLRPWLRMWITRYRKAYLKSLRLMDQVVTNSQHVRQLLLGLTGVDSTVVYPPTDLTHFHWLGQKDYYLSLGRLESNKQVDRVIRAFRQMPEKKLVVASGGSQLGSLKALSAGALNIHITDWRDEMSFVDLIGNSIACLYIPRDEDFGMSAVESMAAGKPVIGVNEGGLKEIIDQPRTGFLLPKDPSVESICYAVRMLDSDVAANMREDCEDRAKLFSLDLFISRMRELIHVENGGNH